MVNAITTENVNVFYGDKQAINNISLNLLFPSIRRKKVMTRINPKKTHASEPTIKSSRHE